MSANPPIDEWTPGFRASDMPVVNGGDPNLLEAESAEGSNPKPPPPGAPIVEHALYYVRRGWLVFPCRPKNRAPFFAGGFTSRQPKRRQSGPAGYLEDGREGDRLQLCRELGREFSADAVKFELKAVARCLFAGGVEKLPAAIHRWPSPPNWDLDPFLLGTPDGTVDLRSAAPMPTPAPAPRGGANDRRATSNREDRRVAWRRRARRSGARPWSWT